MEYCCIITLCDIHMNHSHHLLWSSYECIAIIVSTACSMKAGSMTEGGNNRSSIVKGENFPYIEV